MAKRFITCDGNTAAAQVAYKFSEVAAIYPITPSSPMGELADMLAAKGHTNLFGEPVRVAEMQSEAGASGAIHGSLTAGALTTTFTASQGLMLMLPNMFKIAGELLPAVFHVSARSLAIQALSIFGDHSDVMAARGTGFALLSSGGVQEAQDMAAIAHLAALESSVPFLHFFDGFRTSHEIQKIEAIEDEILSEMLDQKYVEAFRTKALSSDHPVCKVGAENPDVYFQGRETVNRFYNAVPGIVRKYMKMFAEKTGRSYDLFEYVGSPDATKAIIAMGSAVETIDETIGAMNANGEKVGAIKVRLYRPFSAEDFLSVLPETVQKIAVLDRTKEPGSAGEPLYLDVAATVKAKDIQVIGGRYGLSSKEFTPSHIKAIFTHLDNAATHGFTVGINDDVTHTSIPMDEDFKAEQEGIIRCKFWGYGSDGTVSANKNSIKIIGNNTERYVQGYFQYDSKKSGGVTVSHLRFGDKKIRSQYLLTTSDFIALHKTSYIGRYDILKGIKEGGVFLINSPWQPEEVFEHLTKQMQQTIKEKNIRLYTIDASAIAHEVGLGNRINTVMQVAFFKLANVIPIDAAIGYIKSAIEKQFAAKGQEIVKMNWEAVDRAIDGIHEVPVPEDVAASAPELRLVPEGSTGFVKDVIEPIMHRKGDSIPVSKMPIDGAVPTGTTKIEKRGVALEVPEWKPENCIQCTQCSLSCPHAAIRVKQIPPEELAEAPGSFTTIKSKTKNDKDLHFKVQVYPEDCVGCGVCAEVCPAKNKALVMEPIEKARESGENENVDFFESLPDNITDGTTETSIKGSQFKTPLFEFSGACGGCGETPYVKLVTQLFGERMLIANATGCSSIYGGTFPTTPYCTNEHGEGPAWANSLFEDNAEYGYGFHLANDTIRKQLKNNIEKVLRTGTTEQLHVALERMLDIWDSTDEDAMSTARRIRQLLPDALEKVYGKSEGPLKKVNELKDFLIKKSIWIIGGDGWAYDIGYGGLDHVLAQGQDVNVLVVDTEVYSNTGGQSSKATPRGATAKFAMAGKPTPKKNLGLMMMSYGNVYVASVNMGANPAQVVKAMVEAERYPGPSIIIAYAPCIAHGINMQTRTEQMKKAGQSGYWPLYRFNPMLAQEGKNPFVWESRDPTIDFQDYILNEIRYKSLTINFPDRADKLFKEAEDDAKWRFDTYAKFQDKKE